MSDLKNDLTLIKTLLDEEKHNLAFEKCITIIQEYPYIAQLWVHLGESLLHLGAGKMAEMAFKRALLLDPKARWAEDLPLILSQVNKGKEIAAVINLFNLITPKITAAIICKNESRCIARCLSSMTDAVDEILVIDTGSTDNTLEIVNTFPKARIISFQWCDDFSAARNFGLAHITTEWVIWVDADEYLNPEDIPVIKEVAGIFHNTINPSIIGIVIHDLIADRVFDDYGAYRMFNLKFNFKYWGKIHERIGGAKQCEDREIFRTYVRLRFFHDGYNKTQLTDKNKIERNLVLLKKSFESNPQDPRLLYFYGRELLASGNSEKAVEILMLVEKFCTENDRKEIAIPAKLLLIKAYINLQEYDNSEAICEKLLAEYPNFPDAFYYLSKIQTLKAKQLLKLAEVCVLETKKIAKDYSGDLSPSSDILNWQIDQLLADIQFDLGNYKESLISYENLMKKATDNIMIDQKIALLKRLIQA